MRTVYVYSSVLILVLAFATTASPQNASPQTAKPATPPASAAVSKPESDSAAQAAAAKLPVRRVILYKSGVGYFEHLGDVRGDQSVRIDFTSGQLNDVLQSLTVLDLNGGRITGVNYNSEAPLSQRLGMLRLPLSEQTDASKFYGALRGARLEVHSGNAAITGRLLSIEQKTRVTGETSVPFDVITLVSDTGEVRSIEMSPAVSVRLAERDVNEEVGRYLGLLSSERQQDLRRLTIATSGAGDRELYVSYISEVPIWKTTYRIVLPSKSNEQPLLQGWAIVDNTVGEDWDNVELSLVAGAPQSFIQPLSQPYYTRRPVVPLPELAQLTPQTHESAMLGGLGSVAGTITDPSGAVVSNAEVKLFDQAGNLVASKTTDDEGHYDFGDLPSSNYRLQVSMRGFNPTIVNGLVISDGRNATQDVALRLGSVSETVEVEAAPAGVGSGSGGGVGLGVPGGAAGGIVSGPRVSKSFEAGVPAAAQGQELGDLFEYKLKDRVTIHKNESSLVPIVQTHVSAEKVSLWNAASNSPRPLRALWLTNSSSLTLDGGSFSILEDEAFAGEGLTDSIKPGEKRLLSYAADLGARVESYANTTPERVTRVHIAHGVMIQTSEYRQETKYTIRDDDTTPRTIIIEHPLRGGWLISGDGPKPEETTSSVYRFRVPVESKATAILTVHESQPVQSRFDLVNVTDDQVKLFVQQRSITPEIEAALRKIIEQKARVTSIDAEIQKRNAETKKIFDDQQRIRENLKALKGSAEERALTERYTQQLTTQETRLETLQRETTSLQDQRDQAQADLDKMIETLSLDANLQASSGAPGVPSGSTRVTVPANEGWTDTGINLKTGDTVTVSGSGSVVVTADGHIPAMSPAGYPPNCTAAEVYGQFLVPFPAPQLPCWSLIGRIGADGTIFEIGAAKVFRAQSNGELYLGVNDNNLRDNSGNWLVSILVN
jgi:Carboxypeptidase regulatory-like domain